MAGKKQQTQLDYFMDVLLRNYCRTAEENEFLYDELTELRSVVTTLFHENSELRFLLTDAGVEAPSSAFVTEEELAHT
jgi:hypothetical protein